MKETKIHLCDSCKKTFPECEPVESEFGDGYGNDNVIECSGYEKDDDKE